MTLAAFATRSRRSRVCRSSVVGCPADSHAFYRTDRWCLPNHDAGSSSLPTTLAASAAARPGCRRSPTARSAAAAARRSAISRSRTASRCQPRSPTPNACTSSTITARRSANSRWWSTLGADEHGFKRLWRGEQQVWGAGEDRLAPRGRGVAVPEGDPATRPGAVDLQTRQQVVEQRLQRAQVEDRQAGPAFGGHPGQDREGGRLGLAARGGREQQRVVAAQYRLDGRRAAAGGAWSSRGWRPGGAPASDEGREWSAARRLGHRSSSTSSAVRGAGAAAALRSVSVSSVAERVSL